MTPGMIWGMALADVRDRYRRPAYAVTLLAAVALGYVAAPSSSGRWVVMYIGNYRGVYNSAYIGTVIALAGALWLTLGGFYVVRSAVARDARSGVGELLAATRMRSATYLAAKFVSNFVILASMVAVLALTAAVLQLARGESMAVNPIVLLTPFVVLALPLAAFTAAAALLFDAVAWLRGGLGNILWFFIWMVLAIGGQSANAPLGGIGVHAVARSMSEAMARQDVHVSAGDFSLGLIYLDDPLRTFHWDGLSLSVGFLAGRTGLTLVAVALALLPGLWFNRFDPAGGRFGTRSGAGHEPAARAGTGTAAAPELVTAGAWAGRGGPPASPFGLPVESLAAPSPADTITLASLPAPPARRSRALGRLIAGEIRILMQAISVWWWLGFVALAVIGLVAPTAAVTRMALPLGWIWPILVWSRLGTQQYENGVDVLLDAYPNGGRRLIAEWAAGVALATAAGLTPLVRLAISGDGAGVAAWVGGALLIPSLALALGSLSRSQRLFQVLYLALWYGVVNGIHSIDYMGVTRQLGDPITKMVPLSFGLAAFLLAVSIVVTVSRRRLRA